MGAGPGRGSDATRFGPEKTMTDVFLERAFEQPLTEGDVRAIAEESGWCFDLHKVNWHGSFLSSDGRRMVCWFDGPDAESARLALRKAKADMRILWSGTVHDAPGLTDATAANVLVERSFDAPVTLESIQEIEDAASGCLAAHHVAFVRTFFSRDRRRMICLYRAPDAESVRVAQRQADMPVDRIWAFRRIGPEHLRR